MPNALQITDPNADNPLAQAPSWADAAQSVAGTVSSGVDALGQWLAAQRAKSSQRYSQLADMPSLYARVPADTASDIGPSVMGHWVDPRFAVYARPDTGGFPDTGAMPSNEQVQDVARQQRMADVMRQLTEMMNQGVGSTYADRARFDALQKEYQTLGTQSPGYRYDMRLSDVHRAVPADADVMMQAIQQRQRLGRGE